MVIVMVTAQCSAVTSMVLFFGGLFGIVPAPIKMFSGLRYAVFKIFGYRYWVIGSCPNKMGLSVNPYLSYTVAPKFFLGLKGNPAYDNIYG